MDTLHFPVHSLDACYCVLYAIKNVLKEVFLGKPPLLVSRGFLRRCMARP